MDTHPQNTIEVTVDLSVIEGFLEILPPEQVRELICECQSEVSKRLSEISTFTQEQDIMAMLDKIKSLAHDLKGVGGNFGLTALSQAAGQLQQLATPPYTSDAQCIKNALHDLMCKGTRSLDIIDEVIDKKL